MEKRAHAFDVCVICALPKEARAFLEVVQPHCESAIEKRNSPRYHYSYRFATLKNNKDESLTLHISWPPRYGPQEMILHLSHILEEYQPRLAIMTGICAGDAQRVQLGDLVIAERTFTYDNGKFALDEHGQSVHEHDTMTYQLDGNILQFLGLFDDWKPLIMELERPPSPPESGLKQREVRCHIKALASGNAVRADDPFEDVRAPVRGTVAIDMEGAALGLVMSRHPLIPWLIVKGVCDYADQDKNDVYHDYAARASALYALSFIRAYVTNERLPALDESSLASRAGPSRVGNMLFPHNTFSKREPGNRDRESLLKSVRNHINKRLQPLRHNDTQMELHLQEQAGVLDNPLQSGLEIDEISYPASSITQIYDRHEQLLILGEAGAGKTTLLCYLAGDLLTRAEGNPHNLIPVVLYLSTWARQQISLDKWVVDELWRLYRVNKRTGESWVKDNQFLLLLDGLDEVESEVRTHCIEAINNYRENGKHLVVCCRINEYQHLSPPLSLGQAISVLPLTPQEVERYIALKKGEASELKNVLNKDVTLANAARTPLILSLLLQVPQEVIDRSIGSTSEKFKQNLLNAYVQKANLRDEEKHWLIFLAQQMKEKKQDPFFLEAMQPTWLPKSYWRAVYLSLTGAFFGAIIGMICFTLLGAFVEGLSSLLEWFHPWSIDPEIAVPLAALLLGGPIGGSIGLCIGLLCPLEQIAINPAEERSILWRQKVPEIILFLIVAITGELIGLASRPTILAHFLTFIQITERLSITALPGGIVIWITYELINAFIGCLIYTGNFFLFASGKRVQKQSFQGFCQSIGSCARRGGMIGLVIGIFDTLFGGFLGGPIYRNITKPLFQESLSTFWGALIIGICSGLLSWFAIGLLTIVSRKRLDSAGRTVNQGIQRSLRYSILTAIVCWILFWGLDQVVGGLDFRAIEGIILGFAVCLIPGLMNGGAAYIKHAVLRYVLRQANCTRRNYTDFLNSMVVRHRPDSQDKRRGSRKKSKTIQAEHKERRILQEIGGGYVFTYNPLLLDYFENLKDPISPPQQKTRLNGNDFPHQLMIRIIASVIIFLIITSSIFGGIFFSQHRLDGLITRCNAYTSIHTNNSKSPGASYGLGVDLGLALYHASYIKIEEHAFDAKASLKNALPYANTLVRRGVTLDLEGVNGLKRLADCSQIVNDAPTLYSNILAMHSKYTGALQGFSDLYGSAYQLGTNIALARGLASEILSSHRSSINSYLKEAQKFANLLVRNHITLNISELQNIINNIYIMKPDNLYNKILTLNDEYQAYLNTVPM